MKEFFIAITTLVFAIIIGFLGSVCLFVLLFTNTEQFYFSSYLPGVVGGMLFTSVVVFMYT